MIRKPIRVLVVDDSLTARTALKAAMATDPSIEVVGEAANGVEGVRLARALRPDVITMDVNMPLLDGVQATEEIMAEAPARILMVCSVDKQREVELSFRSIQAGALELIAKGGIDQKEVIRWGQKVVEAVRLMSEVAVVRRRRKGADSRIKLVPPRPAGLMMLGIAASTGGPPVLASLFSVLPRNFPLSILVAQHIAAGFSEGLARWLGTHTKLPVEIARPSIHAEPGHIYLAPDGYHLEVIAGGLLNTVPASGGHCPSGDRLFRSLARHYGPAAIGLILTGMGDDGAQGLLELHRTGALTLGQDQPSCVVFGMPQVAAQLNAVTDLLSVEALKDFLRGWVDDAPRDPVPENALR